MGGHIIGGIGLILALALAGCADETGQQCRLGQLADLPVLNPRGVPIVPAQIDGKPVAFIVDTGASVSTISPEAADALHLPFVYGAHINIMGIGGLVQADVRTVRNLRLGNGTARNVTFASTGDFHARIAGLPVVGLFGGDFLSNYDVALDLPSRELSLFVSHHCASGESLWAGSSYVLPFDNDSTAVVMRIRLNGKPVEAVLDSGASATVIEDNAAEEAGVGAAALRLDPTVILHGVDSHPVEAHRHRFRSLQIGDETFAPATLNVADVPHTLLGEDFLRRRRVWIAYPKREIYVQRLGQPPVPAAVPPAGMPAAPPAGGTTH